MMRKPPESQPYRTFDEKPFIVGSAMYHGLSHASNRLRFDRLMPDKIKLAGYAAHAFIESEQCELKTNRFQKTQQTQNSGARS